MSIGPCHKRTAREPGLPHEDRRQVDEIVPGGQPRKVPDHVRHAAGFECRDRDRLAGRPRSIPQVDQSHPLDDRPRQDPAVVELCPHRPGDQLADAQVRRVVAKEMFRDPVGNPQRSREERPLGLLHDDEAARHEIAGRRQPRALASGRRDESGEVESEADRRPPP